MRQSGSARVGRYLFLGLCGWMAVSFAVGALTKFYWAGTFFGPSYAVKFAGWGYPSWFRFVVGAGELVSAGTMLVPRLRFVGSCILLVILGGAVTTHLANHDTFGESVAAPVHLVLAVVVAWFSRPADWRLVWDAARPRWFDDAGARTAEPLGAPRPLGTP